MGDVFSGRFSWTLIQTSTKNPPTRLDGGRSLLTGDDVLRGQQGREREEESQTQHVDWVSRGQEVRLLRASKLECGYVVVVVMKEGRGRDGDRRVRR